MFNLPLAQKPVYGFTILQKEKNNEHYDIMLLLTEYPRVVLHISSGSAVPSPLSASGLSVGTLEAHKHILTRN